MDRLMMILAPIGCAAVLAAGVLHAADATPPRAAQRALIGRQSPPVATRRAGGTRLPRWRLIPGPSTSTSFFAGVAAVSARDVWAVGSVGTGTSGQPLAAHWNGTRWHTVASPYPGPTASLRAVAALSARDVWAVGDVGDVAATRPLIEHWDGRSWRIVSTPRVSGRDVLLAGVVALSATDIWAVGSRGSGLALRS